MEPVSAIIGLGSAVVGIIEVVTRSVTSLRNLQTRYRLTDLKLNLLIGQLLTLKAALSQITNFLDTRMVAYPQDYQVEADLMVPIDNCKLLIAMLGDRFQNIEEGNRTSLGTSDRVRFLWEEDSINEFLNLLNNQINALNLLLTALQCRSSLDQQHTLQRNELRLAVKQVKDDMSSLLWLRDADSCISRRSASTGTSDMLDTIFDFDQEILNSRAYHLAARSNMKRAVLSGRTKPREDQGHSNDASKSFEDEVPVDENTQTIREEPEATWFAFDTLGMQATTVSATADLDLYGMQPKLIGDSMGIYQRKTVEIQSSERSSLFTSRPQESDSAIRRPVTLLGDVRRWGGPRSMKSPRAIKSSLETKPQNGAIPPKVLVLGTSDAGKSTLLKSIGLFCDGFPNGLEIRLYKEAIFNKLVTSMRDILREMMETGMVFGAEANERHAYTILTQPSILEIDSLPSEVASAVATLWKASSVQPYVQGFEGSNNTSIDENSIYYFDSIDRIGQPRYMPTEQDILRSLVPTIGLHEKTYRHREHSYRMYDVGGTRSERKKWFHYFADTDVILFVIDVSGYDMMLPETPPGQTAVNKLQEDLSLFDTICNSSWSTQVGIVVCFNKVGLLERKLVTSPVKNYVPDYEGDPYDLDEVKIYFSNKFVSLIQEFRKPIDVLWINALDGPMAGKAALDVVSGIIDRRKAAMN